MMGRTHALFGINSLWLLTFLPPEYKLVNFGVLAVAATFGALLPDLDAVESTLKHVSVGGIRPFVPASIALQRDLGHRGLLHSLLGLGLFSGIALSGLLWWSWEVWAAMVLGYSSHLVADSLTKSGILFLYPRTKRYHLLPEGWRFTTGSLAEEALFPLLATASLLLLLLHLPLNSGV